MKRAVGILLVLAARVFAGEVAYVSVQIAHRHSGTERRRIPRQTISCASLFYFYKCTGMNAYSTLRARPDHALALYKTFCA